MYRLVLDAYLFPLSENRRDRSSGLGAYVANAGRVVGRANALSRYMWRLLSGLSGRAGVVRVSISTAVMGRLCLPAEGPCSVRKRTNIRAGNIGV